MADAPTPDARRLQLLEDAGLLTDHRRKRATSTICDMCSDEWPCGSVESVANGLAERDVGVAERAVHVAAQMYPTMTRDMVTRGSVRTWLNGNATRIAEATVAQERER